MAVSTDNINSITSNIDELLLTLNDTDNILINNSLLESDIKNQGGTILYSFNNIIIASEISETYWNELQKDSNVDFIQDLPLKQYGGIDYNLIGQMSSNSLFDSIISSVSTTNNISGSTSKTNVGIYPIITNSILVIAAATNSTFTYVITATGTQPITYQVIAPDNYSGILKINNINVLTGSVNKPGTYNLTIKAINAFGSYTKDLVLTTTELVSITNSNLTINNNFGSTFSYSIESTGSLPKSYFMSNQPAGLSLSGNIISGKISSEGTYTMTISVSGSTNVDSKDLIINVGTPPVINSLSQYASEINKELEYIITSIGSDVITYSMSGALNKGLIFKTDRIVGTPTIIGSNIVNIKATNAFGESSQNLTITIYNMNS
jgi:hypothetical protein